MKGYIFSLADVDPVDVMALGAYGVRQPPPASPDWRTRLWSRQMLSTLADYSTIRPGDRLFFFSKRRIYGIGRVIDSPTRRGAFLNYPGADQPSPSDPKPSDALIGPRDSDEWRRIRLVIPFVPDPLFFSEGIDMDEVLSAPGADVAWGLRFFFRASFKQLGEAETRLLIQVFERRFGNAPLRSRQLDPSAPKRFKLLGDTRHRCYSTSKMVAGHEGLYLADGMTRDEETLHGLLVDAMDPPAQMPGDLAVTDRLDVFHELVASPPKPALWADAMDIVGTSHFPGGGSSGLLPTAAHFQILEAKSGAVEHESTEYEMGMAQLMKYVDFLTLNYAGGNYGAVDAVLVAANFSDEVLRRHDDALRDGAGIVSRSYVLNPREASPTRVWNNVRLLTYEWDSSAQRLRLRDPFASSGT